MLCLFETNIIDWFEFQQSKEKLFINISKNIKQTLKPESSQIVWNVSHFH